MKINRFFMPKNIKIAQRSSSITNAFVNGIIPSIKPTNEEILEVLQIFDMTENDVRCVYCGDKCTEWDHLRPLVKEQRPTGYISEIKNLVPACGKCNQSKGNKNWKDWMRGDSERAIIIQHLEGFGERINKLDKFERFGNVQPLNIRGIIGNEAWNNYWAMHDNLLLEMKKCQDKQNEIKKVIDSYYKDIATHENV